MKADDINPSIEAEIRRRLIARVTQSIEQNLGAFIRKIEGGVIPDFDTVSEHGKRVVVESKLGPGDWAEFFVWRKHNVLAWRYGRPGEEAAVIFCHLYPDDYPEALANFIAELP